MNPDFARTGALSPAADRRLPPSMEGLRRYVFVRHRHNWGLLARFSIVGTTGVGVNLLVFGLLLATGANPAGVIVPLVHAGFGLRWYHAFSTGAFLVANLWNFQLNRHWTFQTAGRSGCLREYVPFLIVGVAGQALGLVVLTLLVHSHWRLSVPVPFGLLDHSTLFRSRELWAQAITLAIVTPVSFLGNKLWTFRAARGALRSAGASRRQFSDRQLCLLAAAGIAAVLVYGSLLPFDFMQAKPSDIAAKLLREIHFPPSPLASRTDFFVNVVTGLPFGFVLMGALRSSGRRRALAAPLAGLAVAGASAVLGTSLELAQALSPTRFASWNDVMGQVLGAAAGSIGWTLTGPDVIQWARQLGDERDARGFGVRVLQLYVPVYVLLQLAPPHPQLATAGFAFEVVRHFGGNVLLGAPIGVLALLRPGRTSARAVAIGFLLGVSTVLSVELTRGFIWSRYADWTDVLAGAVGVAIGVASAEWARGRARGVTESRAWRPRYVIAASTWTLLLIVAYWYPFNFRVPPGIAWEHLRHVPLMPFQGYYPAYTADPLQGMQKVLCRVLLAFPLGFLLRMAVPITVERARQVQVATTGAATVVLLGIAAGEVFLPAAVPDPTGVMIAIGGAALGAAVGSALSSRQAAGLLATSEGMPPPM